MLATTASSTWGITGEQFLWGYGTLCALAVLAVWHERRRVLGPAATSRDPQPDLDAYRLALLSGGPDHAITVAAAELMRDGRLRGDGVTISANGAPAATADALEREVFEAVRREPGRSIEEVEAHVRDSAAMTAMTEQMTHSGLLVGGSEAARMRLLWVVPALLAAVGLARILAGGDDGAGAEAGLFALVAACVLAAVRLAGTPPLATNRGRSVLDRRRSESTRARLYPAASETGLMTALYGGGALWVADPVTASALHVPREKEPGSSGAGGGGRGAGGWSGDGGWFSGWFGDGGGSDGGCCGGGGGGGGGGCGGGGGG